MQKFIGPCSQFLEREEEAKEGLTPESEPGGRSYG
jgi:hypothetical protein